METSAQSSFHFSGFSSPNGSIIPDEAFDVIMPQCTPGQWKVLSYLMRRIFGFKKEGNCDTISLKQICTGIKRKDGRVLDEGTGLSKSAVWQAFYGYRDRRTDEVKTLGLIAMGIVKTQQNKSHLRDFDPTTYTLCFIGDEESPSEASQDNGQQNQASPPEEVGEGCSLDKQPLFAEQTTPVRLANNIQETAYNQTGLQQSNSSNEEKSKGKERKESASKVAISEKRSAGFIPISEIAKKMREGFEGKTASPSRSENLPESALDAPEATNESRREKIPTYKPHPPRKFSQGVKEQKPIKSARIATLITDISHEFDDQKVTANISRAHNIWQQTTLDEATFIDWCYLAAGKVRERAKDKNQPSLRNRMPYFFSTVRHDLGLST